MARRLREGVLKDALSVDVLDGLKDSPYGNIPSFMDGGPLGERFLRKALTTEYDNARNALRSMGRIESVKAGDIGSAFQELLVKCQKIESANRDALEKLASNYVIDLFSVPDDTVRIEARLVGAIEDGDAISPVEPFDGDTGFEAADIEDLSGIDGKVAKRHFLNALNMGAGKRMSANIRGYIEDLYDIDSRLPQMYKELLALNDYMIFDSPDLGISDKSRNQIGIVNVRYGSRDELVTISARGVVFPVLLSELIRGFMELFSAHGLPKERDRAEYVLKKADYLKAEPWQMRIGPYMWNIFTGYFEDTDTGDMPYIYQTLSRDKALREKGRISFNGKMNKRKDDKSIITDSCMSPEEF